jgi:hypothetical protein
MNSRERVMAALQLKEPDRVPFMDFADTIFKQKIMGTEEIDEAEFAKKIGMDAIYFAENENRRRCHQAALGFSQRRQPDDRDG